MDNSQINGNASDSANETTNNKELKLTPPRDAPPPTPISKGLNLSGPLIKKDKRQNSSRFNISKNRELTSLPQLAGFVSVCN